MLREINNMETIFFVRDGDGPVISLDSSPPFFCVLLMIQLLCIIINSLHSAYSLNPGCLHTQFPFIGIVFPSWLFLWNLCGQLVAVFRHLVQSLSSPLICLTLAFLDALPSWFHSILNLLLTLNSSHCIVIINIFLCFICRLWASLGVEIGSFSSLYPQSPAWDLEQ